MPSHSKDEKKKTTTKKKRSATDFTLHERKCLTLMRELFKSMQELESQEDLSSDEENCPPSSDEVIEKPIVKPRRKRLMYDDDDDVILVLQQGSEPTIHELFKSMQKRESQEDLSSDEENCPPSSDEVIVKPRRKRVLFDDDDAILVLQQGSDSDDDDEPTTQPVLSSEYALQKVVKGDCVSWIKLSKQMYPDKNRAQLTQYRQVVRRRLIGKDNSRNAEDFKDHVTPENLKVILNDIVQNSKTVYKPRAVDFLEVHYAVLMKYFAKV